MTAAQYQLQDIRFCYADRAILAIDSANFEAKKTYAILGENGSGKTTLLNLLAMLTTSQQGVLFYRETRVSPDNQQRLRTDIAYVQQKPYLFHCSVFDNIVLPLKLRGVDKRQRREKAHALIEQLAIAALASRNARELSGGELQKVALARALITEPQVLILDEPFSHLDPEVREEITSLLLQIRQQQTTTMILSLHDRLQAHVLADEVLTLANGRLLDANLMNLFAGRALANGQFDTGRICVHLPEQPIAGSHIAVDARQLVLSQQRLVSSMRNEFAGRVLSLQEYQGQIRVSLAAGETFQCIITHAALKALNIHPGDEIWVYFKSSSIKIVQ